MRFYRVGLPALIGLLVLLSAALGIRAAAGGPGPSLVDAVHSWLLPVAFGVGMLLLSLAISRGTRLGYGLGLGLAVVMVLGGLALVAVEVPFLAQGGLSAALGAGVVILASAWILAWAVHGISMRRARATFAAGWQANDRRFGIVLGSLAGFAGAAYFSLGFVLSNQAAAAETSFSEAASLVAFTSVDVSVIEARFGPSTDGTAGQQVEKLTLVLAFTGHSAYALAQVPTVCLTDAATSRDPAYKPGMFCWGGGGSAILLSDEFRDLAMLASPRTVRLELERGTSLCGFGAGEWDAQVQIAPRSADALPGAPPEVYTHTSTFVVEPPPGAPALGETVTGSSCLGSTVSP